MKKPPRPNVIVEDIDELERRRLKSRGRKRYSLRDIFSKPTSEGPNEFRRLASFAMPYRGALATALVMSVIAAAAKLTYVFIFEQMLEPILEPKGEVTPLAGLVDLALQSEWAVGSGTGSALREHFGVAYAVVMNTWHKASAPGQLAFAAFAFVLLTLVEQINKYVQRLIMRTAALNIVADIRNAAFEKVLTFSMRFFHANHSGRLMSRITSDLAGLGALLVDLLVALTTDFFTLMGALVYLYIKGGWLVLAGLGIAVLTFVPVQQLARRIRRKEISNKNRLGTMFLSLSEIFSAQKVVKAFNAEPIEQRRFAAANAAYTQGQAKAEVLRARVQPVVDIIGSTAIAGMMWVGGMQVLQGEWKKASFMAVLILLYQAVAAMRRLGDSNSKMQSGLASADRVATVLYADAEIVDAPDAVAIDGIHDRIVYRDVSYDHDDDHPVLRGISLELLQGQTLALIGPTGSGKTTLADLLPRFYEVDAGAILIDGRDIRSITVESLRQQIALVTQETVLFRTTISQNIAYGRPDATQEQIESAARAANAHDFILRMPHGYASEVGERGLTLSGGERQRVAIARALLKNAPILILDEATSALDTSSEKLVQDAINRLKEGRTTIVIAHRLSTVRSADLIVVLEDGHIKERGTHAELLEHEGLYAHMLNIQHQR